jgi:hypothetical protein
MVLVEVDQLLIWCLGRRTERRVAFAAECYISEIETYVGAYTVSQGLSCILFLAHTQEWHSGWRGGTKPVTVFTIVTTMVGQLP